MTLSRCRSSWFGLAALISFLWTISWPLCPISAEEVVCDPQDPDKCSVALKSGDSAPFDGQLLTPKLAIDLGQKAESFEVRLDLELKFKTRLLQIDLDLEKSLRENDRKAFDLERKLLMTRLEEAHSRPWYEHPAFVSVTTAVVVVLVFVGAGYALKNVD